MKANRRILIAAMPLALFLLYCFIPVIALGADVNVTPASIGLGGEITLTIEPHSNLNGVVVVAGPLTEDNNPLSTFHADLLTIDGDQVLSLADALEYSFIYPTGGTTQSQTYTWTTVVGDSANTDDLGWYVTIVLLSDGSIDLDELYIALEEIVEDMNFNPVMTYFIENFQTIIQFTIARIFVVPESPFGTIMALASPLGVFGCLKVIKRRRIS